MKGEKPFRRNSRIGFKKAGLILPSVNCILEPELYAVAPDGISFHTTRILLTETTPEGLTKMEEDLDPAARLLESINPDAVVYACTSGSFIKGLGWDNVIIRRIRKIVGCPTVTTSTAMVQALRKFGVRRIALATPYLEDVNEREIEFLEKSGFEVVGCKGLGLSGRAIREEKPERVYELAKDTDNPSAEALCISCTDFRAMEVIDLLETELDKPVISSNQVTLWALLRLLNHVGEIRGYGRLLRDMPSLSTHPT